MIETRRASRIRRSAALVGLELPRVALATRHEGHVVVGEMQDPCHRGRQISSPLLSRMD
jgi:hypothetical protein